MGFASRAGYRQRRQFSLCVFIHDTNNNSLSVILWSEGLAQLGILGQRQNCTSVQRKFVHDCNILGSKWDKQKVRRTERWRRLARLFGGNVTVGLCWEPDLTWPLARQTPPRFAEPQVQNFRHRRAFQSVKIAEQSNVETSSLTVASHSKHDRSSPLDAPSNSRAMDSQDWSPKVTLTGGKKRSIGCFLGFFSITESNWWIPGFE